MLRRPVQEPPRTPNAVRFAIPPPADGAFYEFFENTGLSVSPDGTRIAFTARSGAEPFRIWMRPVAELNARPLAGTEGATSLFWSPDGGSIAFFAPTKLRRIDLRSGAPVSICDVREGIGFSGTWGADGQILFSSIEGEAIWSVPAGGGTPTATMKPDPARDEMRLNWPFFLPDGRRLLYLQRRRDGSSHKPDHEYSTADALLVLSVSADEAWRATIRSGAAIERAGAGRRRPPASDISR